MIIPFQQHVDFVPVSACRNSGFSNPKAAKSSLKNLFFQTCHCPLFLFIFRRKKKKYAQSAKFYLTKAPLVNNTISKPPKSTWGNQMTRRM